MKKRSIVLITVSMAVALLGVMAMQFYFLRQSYRLQSELFDSSVNEALNNVISKVNQHDQISFLNARARFQPMLTDEERKAVPANVKYKHKKFVYQSVDNGTKTTIMRDSADSHFSSVIVMRNGSKLNKERIAKLKDSLKQLVAMHNFDRDLDEVGLQVNVEEFTNEFGQVQRTITPKLVPLPTMRIIGKLNKYDTTRFVYNDPQFGPQIISERHINPLWQRDHDRKEKELQLKRVQHMLQVETGDQPESPAKPKTAIFEKLANDYQRTDEPLQQRLNQAMIDSLLRFELINSGITLPFSYEVTTAHNDSLIFSKAMDTKGERPVFVAGNTYKRPIFNQEVIKDPGQLQLLFPQKNSLILSRMGASMATTGGLLMVLIFCFGFTIYAILRQKKISEMKTDFINNMTHEFKTPVSTIMIASEALRDDEIAQDKKRVSKLANIIYEENVRLGSHIERVLNIAKIEKDDFKLDIKTVDVNEMITTVLDSMLLKLQKHDVKMEMDLASADESLMIKADELHFSNVIYNLVDNAIKYSADKPEITITTQIKNKQVLIKVADKGIGMSYDQQAKIFEQFYRIPTGNLHDVKGFGLGLSYVNTIVKRLNGSISVKSEKDKGSEFELKFDRVSA
ncbi:HAMP domain-containing histidine kinase [Mucilaginibacter sp. HMF5004]|uniref:sensor histidine kinase n=1 Tax=Mucilaginibacter rivuli TaxID=2857527 RepID=UPI001C5E13A9|nr:HAMP domain-containing sensor histidine kinase [Mucilaginibacter rivuli]MBW4888220.1 HAMP domain-containing histidine kinase [Mucilaginibacter rivuli]